MSAPKRPPQQGSSPRARVPSFQQPVLINTTSPRKNASRSSETRRAQSRPAPARAPATRPCQTSPSTSPKRPSRGTRRRRHSPPSTCHAVSPNPAYLPSSRGVSATGGAPTEARSAGPPCMGWSCGGDASLLRDSRGLDAGPRVSPHHHFILPGSLPSLEPAYDDSAA